MKRSALCIALFVPLIGLRDARPPTELRADHNVREQGVCCARVGTRARFY